MRLAFFGDIVGRPGRRAAEDALRVFRTDPGLDAALANVENASGGLGLTLRTAAELKGMGFLGMSSGNHIWKHREIYPYLDEQPFIVRPANYPRGAPGRGMALLEMEGGQTLALMNLIGRTYMEPVDCPFSTADALLASLPGNCVHVVVDFHAEATSEKIAMLYHLEGRVSAVLGTHTHVQTNDAHVSDKGTAFITDLGMCGVRRSVLGMDPDVIVRRMRGKLPERFKPAKGHAGASGVFLTLDDSGRALDIQAFNT